jgi:hypothetical protein
LIGSPVPAAAPEHRGKGRVRGGIFIDVTCDRDPDRLATDARCLEHANGSGEILLGWAALSGNQDECGQQRFPG